MARTLAPCGDQPMNAAARKNPSSLVIPILNSQISWTTRERKIKMPATPLDNPILRVGAGVNSSFDVRADRRVR